jgi:hypothetical protein
VADAFLVFYILWSRHPDDAQVYDNVAMCAFAELNGKEANEVLILNLKHVRAPPCCCLGFVAVVGFSQAIDPVNPRLVVLLMVAALHGAEKARQRAQARERRRRSGKL